MKNKKDSFFEWAKKELTESPSREVDQKILNMALDKLEKPEQGYNFFNFLKPAFAIAISLVFVLVINYKINHPQTNDIVSIEDSAEMILQYENIELMAATQSLTEDEWRDIEGVK